MTQIKKFKEISIKKNYIYSVDPKYTIQKNEFPKMCYNLFYV